MTGATATAAAAAAGSLNATLPASGTRRGGSTDQVERGIRRLFKGLPGDVGVKVVAPGRHGLHVEINASRQMFVGSAIKTFILGEALRQADGPDVVETITTRQLDLDESVWSASSQIFNPPHLSGKVSERTAHEAMILHSDNTGTDMSLKQAGPDNVRRFIRRLVSPRHGSRTAPASSSATSSAPRTTRRSRGSSWSTTTVRTSGRR